MLRVEGGLRAVMRCACGNSKQDRESRKIKEEMVMGMVIGPGKLGRWMTQERMQDEYLIRV